jgi:outer membrane protein assembly factor BamD
MVLLLSSSCSKDAVKGEAAFDPEASIARADELIKEGYYDDAREVLEEIKARDASRQYAMMAKLRIADTYFIDELYDEAAVEYESFLSIHSHHKYASYAQFRLAMTYFKRIGTVDVSASWARSAIREFEKLQRQYPRNPYMDITESRIKMCRRILAEYEFYVGNFYFKKESYEAAVKRLSGMLEKYPDSKMEAQALYYLGLSYENLGQRDKAIRMLNSLLEKFPTIKLSSDARELIASFEENDKE